jgi:hypothetical protein
VVTQDAANWSTPRAQEDQSSVEAFNKRADAILARRKPTGGRQKPGLTQEVQMYGQAAPASSSSLGSRQGLWPTITAHTPDMESNGPNGHQGTYLAGAVKTWATPKASDPQHSGPNMRDSAGNYALPAQAVREQWGTPTARDHKSGRGNEDRQYKELTPMVERQQSGKLNPRWVETLMGLPIGWTMPSCTSPQTIAPMSCDSSATELCLPPQSELSEFSLASWPSPRAGESQQTEELSRLWVENGFKQPKTRGGKARANGSTFDVTLETAARGVAAMEAKP